MFSSIVFTLAEIVQPVAPRQTCLAWMLFAEANIRVCATSVSENKFSPPCSPITTIFDCTILLFGHLSASAVVRSRVPWVLCYFSLVVA